MKAGIYKHYKGGYYQVLGVAQDSTNTNEGALYVVYVSLDATRPGPRMRIRRKREFEEMANSQTEGRAVPRFEYIGDEIPEGG